MDSRLEDCLFLLLNLFFALFDLFFLFFVIVFRLLRFFFRLEIFFFLGQYLSGIIVIVKETESLSSST